MGYTRNTPGITECLEANGPDGLFSNRFHALLDGVKMAIGGLNLSSKKSRVGVVQFAEFVDKKNAITLDDSVKWPRKDLETKIIHIHYKGKNDHCNTKVLNTAEAAAAGLKRLDNSTGIGSTMTQRVMKYAHNAFRQTKRENAPQVLFLMTDGVMEDKNAKAEAQEEYRKLAQDGVVTIAIGIEDMHVETNDEKLGEVLHSISDASLMFHNTTDFKSNFENQFHSKQNEEDCKIRKP